MIHYTLESVQTGKYYCWDCVTVPLRGSMIGEAKKVINQPRPSHNHVEHSFHNSATSSPPLAAHPAPPLRDRACVPSRHLLARLRLLDAAWLPAVEPQPPSSHHLCLCTSTHCRVHLVKTERNRIHSEICSASLLAW
jgi:hypothetical protein